MGKIVCKGKEYETVDDIEYRYLRLVKKLDEQINNGEIEDDEVDKEILFFYLKAICPEMLKVFVFNKESVAVDGIELTIREIKKLVIDARDSFISIVQAQLSSVLESDKTGGREKNEQQGRKAPLNKKKARKLKAAKE